jgi:hypothetical protein
MSKRAKYLMVKDVKKQAPTKFDVMVKKRGCESSPRIVNFSPLLQKNLEPTNEKIKKTES